MNATLSFKTTQTPYGLLHTLRIVRTPEGSGAQISTEYALYRSRPTASALKWVGEAYMASNGTAWRIGRSITGTLVAWKSIRIGKRFDRESYRMRSVPGGYKGDYVTRWSRRLNGNFYSFSRIYWNGGQDGMTLRVYKGEAEELIHEWKTHNPVPLKSRKAV